MSFTHDEYVLAILELGLQFSPRFTAGEYVDAILRLETEFVLVY